MKPFGKLVPRIEALHIIDENVNQISRVEDVPLNEVAGRVLAADLTAALNVPSFDRSSMDGYALKAKDTAGASKSKPRKLRLLGATYAGEAFDATISDGKCVEIATGSPLPKGADAVVMVEHTKLSGSIVEVMREVKPGDNISLEGEDIKRGEVVIKAGEVLTAAKVGAVAALGLTSLRVYARPRVAIYSTGNEIVPQGKILRLGQLYDINSYTLSSIVEANGCLAVRRGPVRDDTQALLTVLKESADYDAVVFSGGSSVGSRDLLAEIVEEIGAVRFHGLDVKPGKPTLFGTVQGIPVFGMPGYPTSCLNVAYIFLIPMLRKMARLPALDMKRVGARLSRPVEADRDREQCHPVRLEKGVALPVFKKSSDITSMAHANGLIIMPARSKKLKKGAKVDVYLLS